MSKLYRNCDCNEWKDNCSIINSALVIALNHGGKGLKNYFFYCPWCGKLLKKDSQTNEGEDDFEISLCEKCGCMTKSIPEGWGRSYGYRYKCGKCGASKNLDSQTNDNMKLLDNKVSYKKSYDTLSSQKK